MKNKMTALLLCAALAATATGCTAEKVSETTASTWEIATETKFDFTSNLMGYDDKDNAISIGYAGEIHHFSPDATDWPRSDNASLCRFGMDVVDGEICYTCGNGGQITKSVDGGKTFVKMADFGLSSPNACKLISFCDKDNGIVASSIKLAITSDGAESWTELDVPGRILALRMASPEVFYCICDDFNFYTTSDGGKTWESTSLNLPLGNEYLNEILKITFSIDGDNSFTVFCIDKENRTLKSYSTTDNWENVTENSVPEFNSAMGLFYISPDGNYLTVTNSLKKTATVFEKQ